MHRSRLLLLLCLGLIGLAGRRAGADPSVRIDRTFLPNGWIAYDVGVIYDPGILSSGLMPATFTSLDGPFVQLQYDGADVDTDVDALAYDGLLGYEAASDSWFYTGQYMQYMSINGGDPASGVFELTQATIFRVMDDRLPVAQLVLPPYEAFEYSLNVAVAGDFVLLVPEPSSTRLASASLLALGFLARARRRRVICSTRGIARRSPR